MQDLCGVALNVFAFLLTLLPDQRNRSSDVTRENKLSIFLMKLKLGLSINTLSLLFGVSPTTASRCFHVVLDILHVALARWVEVPDRYTIKQAMPKCFALHYPDCTFIIDCTEIRTEAPSDPQQQQILYSFLSL